MIAKIFTICFFAILLLIITSCNKYKNEEILGEWDIENYIVNDYDSTQYLDQFSTVIFTISGSYNNEASLIIIPENTSDVLLNQGKFDLIKRNSILKISFDTFINNGVGNWFSSGPLAANANSEFTILYINDNSMGLECYLDSNHYEITLKK